MRISCTTLLQDLNLLPFLTFGFPTFCSVGINLDYPANSSFNQDFSKYAQKATKTTGFTPAAVVLYCMFYLLIFYNLEVQIPYSALKPPNPP